jgi:hypothetical protein
MLNVKYVIQQDKEGNTYPAENPDANGNAWFVKKLDKVNSADEEIMALKALATKSTAVVNIQKFANVKRFEYQIDSLASIKLVNYSPNHLTYEADNLNLGLAVFSEMYYEKGWNAYIDGVLKTHFRVNYALRALEIPEGKHKIEFKFEPQVIKTGSTIVLASTGLLGLLILAAIGFSFWRSRKTASE